MTTNSECQRQQNKNEFNLATICAAYYKKSESPSIPHTYLIYLQDISPRTNSSLHDSLAHPVPYQKKCTPSTINPANCPPLIAAIAPEVNVAAEVVAAGADEAAAVELLSAAVVDVAAAVED